MTAPTDAASERALVVAWLRAEADKKRVTCRIEQFPQLTYNAWLDGLSACDYYTMANAIERLDHHKPDDR